MTIQLAATIVAPTGTGKLFDAYGSDMNKALFQENGASGQPGVLTFNRTPPKPNGVNRVNRGEFKYTSYLADAAGVVYPHILRMEYSAPVFLTRTQRLAAYTVFTAAVIGHASVGGLVLDDLLPL